MYCNFWNNSVRIIAFARFLVYAGIDSTPIGGNFSMAKLSVLMPHPELRELAVSLIAQYPRVTPIAVEFVQTDQVRARAKALEEGGCDLIVARGLQARIARESVRIPIVEMRASTMELASQVLEMKRALADAGLPPRIGIIGFYNMFHSMERFNEILGVELRVYMATDMAQYPFLVDRACGEGCVGVIGGQLVGQRATELGLAYRFLSMGEESVREAFEAASMLGYSIDLLKRANAEMNAMLDNTGTGIVQVDAEGVVQRANRACMPLLGWDAEEVAGQAAESVIPGLPAEEFRRVLEKGSEIDAAVVTVDQTTLLMNMTPVVYDGKVGGAICTFQEGTRISEMDYRLRQEQARKGQAKLYTFSDLTTANAQFQQVLDQARRLARASACVLLEGESGVGKEMLAQCIHNESPERGGAFLACDCAAWHPDDLDGMLFGNFSSRSSSHCLVEQAEGGTLYIKHADALTPELQYKVLRLAQGVFLRNGRGEPERIRLRLILSSEENLPAMVRAGRFRRDLYYAVSAGKLTVPPLRARREDIAFWFRRIAGECQKQYRRYITLSREAQAWLERQEWPGNLEQLACLCRRLALLSDKRTVTLEVVRQAAEALDAAGERQAEAVYRDPAAEALMALLQEHRGDRRKTAAALGISTTTLWRRMKRLGIGRDLTWERASGAQ